MHPDIYAMKFLIDACNLDKNKLSKWLSYHRHHQLGDYYIEIKKLQWIYHSTLTIVNDTLNLFLRIKLMWRQFWKHSNLTILNVVRVGWTQQHDSFIPPWQSSCILVIYSNVKYCGFFHVEWIRSTFICGNSPSMCKFKKNTPFMVISETCYSEFTQHCNITQRM